MLFQVDFKGKGDKSYEVVEIVVAPRYEGVLLVWLLVYYLLY